ncbi:MAG: methyltransferase domain-containing protein [Phycisphaerae bacterium]
MPATQIESNPSQAQSSSRLQRFLNCYWLRPENAFWMSLRSQALESHPIKGPSIDLSCGDGVFSFLHAGGDFSSEYDVFMEVGNLDEVRDAFADMFDHTNVGYEPMVTLRPDRKFEVGTDLKPNMLLKACRLDFYECLVEHDHNHVMPFENEAFQTVHCNSAYWVQNIDQFMSELRRITRKDGRILLSVKLDSMRDYTLNAHRDKFGQRWLDIIGRGRIESWPSLTNDETWKQRFKAANLDIVSRTPFITATHAHIWDVGLRPIAPLLVRMANALDEHTRQEIKSDWIDLLSELLQPIHNANFNIAPHKQEPAEILYELTPA